MTQHWRGSPEEQTAMQKWWRHRWSPGSVYVLDIDRLVCRPDGSDGMLVEEKHVNADDMTWRITRERARAMGWWAALFVYATNDGTPYGYVTSIDATFVSPRGHEEKVENLSFADFDRWICDRFGARLAA